jgi:hypothetical protein
VAFHHEQIGQALTNRFVELMYRTEVRGHSGRFRLRVKE